MHIYLIRHTEYSNPNNIFAFHLPLHLSEKGKADAAKIGLWFKEKKLIHLPIYSSPILRCIQTSEQILAATNSQILIDNRLTETSCPGLQGIKIPEKNSWILEEDDKSRETHASVLERMVDIFSDKIVDGDDCILVSHGDPLTLLYYYLIHKTPPRYFWDPKNSQIIYQRGEIVKIHISYSRVISVKKIPKLFS